ncbi:hypothetical protein JOD27_004022 [Lentzea nigeriaca]|nr:hypothetical protein [Lentzea nigeriaca]MBM7860216.1 hypothetical protein [Lentzea nigeriaca]
MEALRPEPRARGLNRMASAKVVKGTAGEHWALARGFLVGSSDVDQRLTVAEVNQSEQLLPSVQKMSPWSRTEMLRGFEAHVRAIGVERHVVAAVEEATGGVAALMTRTNSLRGFVPTRELTTVSRSV